MKRSILKKQIEALHLKNKQAFHMPGHKRKKVWNDLFSYDITEIPGGDNLHDPQGVIKEVQEKISEIYGSKASGLLVNGTTTGIQSAILGSCCPGEKLIVPTNCHRSVYGALALGRVHGLFITPEIHPIYGFGEKVTLEKVEEAIKKNPEVKGMIITNPTYYGSISDLKKIGDFLHQENKFLIVDEAHGAHLRFSEKLPLDAIAAGGDVVIQSTHKILGSMTQSSLIHFQGNRVNQERIRHFLSILQSSSPSYPLMISIEEAVDEASLKGKSVFEAIIKNHEDYCKYQNPQDPITLYDPGNLSYDRSKWLFITNGISGTAVEKRLLENHGIQCELSGANHVLGMTGIGTTPEDLEELIKGIEAINLEVRSWDKEKKQGCGIITPTEICLDIPLWEGMYYEKKEWVSLEAAVGRIVGDFIIPYPPGIPILLPGSRMTEETMKNIKGLLEKEMAVVGMREGKEILVLKEGFGNQEEIQKENKWHTKEN
ncbi:MAG: aminotransferase class I/II-fold pyridoxal phosphate-dependent enzyme [Eubacteriaceae bacterium]